MNRPLNILHDRMQLSTESENVQIIPRDRIIPRFLSALPRGFGGGRCLIHSVLLAQTPLP